MEQRRSFVIWLLIFGILGAHSAADLQRSRSKREARCYHVSASAEKSVGNHQHADPLDSDDRNPLRKSAETSKSIETPNEDGDSPPQRQILVDARKNTPSNAHERLRQEIKVAAARERAIVRAQQAAAQAAANRGRGGGHQAIGRGRF